MKAHARKTGTIREIFKHLFVGTFALCGLQTLEPFIVYGAKRLAEPERLPMLRQYREKLAELSL